MRGDLKNKHECYSMPSKFGLKRGVAVYQDDRKRGILLYQGFGIMFTGKSYMNTHTRFFSFLSSGFMYVTVCECCALANFPLKLRFSSGDLSFNSVAHFFNNNYKHDIDIISVYIIFIFYLLHVFLNHFWPFYCNI